MEPLDSSVTGGFSAVASISKYGVPNEGDDAVAEAATQDGQARAIIVADGIGSHAFAKEGARIAITSAKEQISRWQVGSDLIQLFNNVHLQVKASGEQLVRELQPKPPVENTCGTTLIVAIETPTNFQIAYVGNGAIFHFRPVFIAQSPLRSFTWSAVNYLNPHSEEQHGREALFRYLSLHDESDRATPTVITINKDHVRGDVLFICTDGIHSADHVTIGPDPDNVIWQTTGTPIVELYQRLRSALLQINDNDTTLPTDFLSSYLSACFDRGLFDDDASAGLLVSVSVGAFIRRRISVRM